MDELETIYTGKLVAYWAESPYATTHSVQIETDDGQLHIFHGDQRPMRNTFEGRPMGTRVLIRYRQAWDWDVQFPDDNDTMELPFDET